MSYCINPHCIARENPARESHCGNCGSPLLICDRYRIEKPLRPLNPAYPHDIYEVQDWGEEEWGTRKVMKVLKFTTNPNFVRPFKQEARVLIWLRHPGIPRVEPGGYFILTLPNRKSLHGLVMEKKEGETVEEIIENQGPISEATAVEWLAQLLEIIGTVHQQGLVHRDIKPSNLILTPQGQLQLIDFGSVADRQSGSTRVGTSGYAAPEQLDGNPQPQSDFFAIGRTCLYSLTGLTPLDLPETAQGEIRWRDRRLDISPGLARLLDDLMAPNWCDRPPTVQTILSRFVQGRILLPDPAIKQDPPPPEF